MKFLLLLLSLYSFQVRADGFRVGSGGDAILCQPSPDNFLNGTYSLDYILTLQKADQDEELVAVGSWEESSDRLYRLFLNKIPSLASYFNDFRRSVFNTSDYSLGRIWEASPFGLVDIQDEYIESRVPANCLTEGKVKVVQAVIRQSKNFSGTKEAIIYKYVPQVTDDLNRNHALQLSYLIVHEWLWDLSSNVDRNRRINQFFHSKKIETMTPAEIEAQLKAMGLRLPRVEPDLFDPASCQGRRLTKKMVEDRYFFKGRPRGWEFMRPLGLIEFESRRRITKCDENYPNCDATWRANSVPYLKNFRTFATLTNSYNVSSAVVKIVSPDFMKSVGRFYTRMSDGQISCIFVDKTDSNLECQIDEPYWIPNLLGVDRESTRHENLPRLKGLITEECVRIESLFSEEVGGRSPHGSVTETHQIQSVILNRFRWDELPDPSNSSLTL